SSGLSTTAAWTVESNQADAFLGRSVASAGDVNGDGYADVIVGSHTFDNGQTDEGRAFVYMGGEADGSGSAYSLRPRQRRPSSTTLIAPGGLGPSKSFEVA